MRKVEMVRGYPKITDNGNDNAKARNASRDIKTREIGQRKIRTL